MRKRNVWLVVCMVGTLALSPVPAARAQGIPPQPGLPEEASQFDFWIGTWRVGPTAMDKVKRFGKGTAILETYTAGGLTGWSVNVFDPASKTWTQTWYTTGGTYFRFVGKKEGDNMVLVAETKNPQTGAVGLLRLSFVNITKDSFEQRYESSTDGGSTWGNRSTVPFVRIK
jgi:hypothetical protein